MLLQRVTPPGHDTHYVSQEVAITDLAHTVEVKVLHLPDV